MNLCTSGGAKGSDLLWGDLAINLNHRLYHISFEGHRVDLKDSLANQKNVFKMSQDSLNLADPYLVRASKTLKRHFPAKSQFVNNLLRRNWFQIRSAERVYAIAEIQRDVVKGGTGWAVQMFLDRELKKGKKVIQCYVLNPTDLRWYQYIEDRCVGIEIPPKPHGRWAGIGTRTINNEIVNKVGELIDVG